jgi:glycosyltransferase involved in cell wall biosynthesis
MILTLSIEQNHMGHVSSVFIYDQEGEKTLLPLFKQHNVDVFYHQKKDGFSLKTVLHLKKIIRDEKIDVLHSHDLNGLIYAALAKIGNRKLHLLHTQHSFIHLFKKWQYTFYEKFFSQFADTLVTVSHHQIADYERLGIKKAICITNGIAYPTNFPYSQAQESRKRELLSHSNLHETRAFGIIPPPEKKWILVPGRIQKSKGQRHLFPILKNLPIELVDQLHFIFIGAPTKEEDLNELTEMYESDVSLPVSYFGYQPDPLEWMMCSEGVVLLSEFEGFPLVPLESIGLAIPTLLSDIPAHQFLKEEATIIGIEDVHSALHWCETIARNPLQKTHDLWMSKAFFRNKYSIRRMTVQYLSAYRIAK